MARVVGERDEILPGGFELGAIVQLTVFSSEYVALDIVSVQTTANVADEPPVAVDDVILVDRRFGASEIFNPIDNDFDPGQGPVVYTLNPIVGPARGERLVLDVARRIEARAAGEL